MNPASRQAAGTAVTPVTGRGGGWPENVLARTAATTTTATTATAAAADGRKILRESRLVGRRRPRWARPSVAGGADRGGEGTDGTASSHTDSGRVPRRSTSAASAGPSGPGRTEPGAAVVSPVAARASM